MVLHRRREATRKISRMSCKEGEIKRERERESEYLFQQQQPSRPIIDEGRDLLNGQPASSEKLQEEGCGVQRDSNGRRS